MDFNEYTTLNAGKPNADLVCAADLRNQADRTLVWGYDGFSYSFHAYLLDGVLERVVYDGNNSIFDYSSGPEMRAGSLVPDKRIYPEASDYEFCKMLTGKGVRLPFAPYNEKREPKAFHGLTHKELLEAAAAKAA